MKTEIIKETINSPFKARLVLIIDIHYDFNYNDGRCKVLLKKIKALVPDYILVAGDLLDEAYVADTKPVKAINQFLWHLNSVAPTIICLGNHDIVSKAHKKEEVNQQKWLNILMAKGIKVVDNNHYYQTDHFTIYGFNPSHYYYRHRHQKLYLNEYLALNRKLKTGYNILLTHNSMPINSPKVLPYFKKYNLILSGHTHGGLVSSHLKGHWGLISPSKTLFPQAVRGLIKYDKMSLIITPGIIKLPKTSSFLHYFNDWYPMSITYIELKPMKSK